MVLHRDIFWVGRQWAVTGHGIQACNQKQRAAFDIEASLLWEHDVVEKLRAETWLNREDFDQALEIARKHFPNPTDQAEPREQSVPETKQANSQQLRPSETPAAPKPLARNFEMHIQSWPARFVRPWRIRIRR
ncbi:MAG: hypothetical protein ACJ8EF_22855 [Bradyrhizobium sp.]|jgi:hypothetical protein